MGIKDSKTGFPIRSGMTFFFLCHPRAGGDPGVFGFPIRSGMTSGQRLDSHFRWNDGKKVVIPAKAGIQAEQIGVEGKDQRHPREACPRMPESGSGDPAV